MIVVGRIDNRADGGWSLFSGVVKEPERDVIHLDWHSTEYGMLEAYIDLDTLLGLAMLGLDSDRTA